MSADSGAGFGLEKKLFIDICPAGGAFFMICGRTVARVGRSGGGNCRAYYKCTM